MSYCELWVGGWVCGWVGGWEERGLTHTPFIPHLPLIRDTIGLAGVVDEPGLAAWWEEEGGWVGG